MIAGADMKAGVVVISLLFLLFSCQASPYAPEQKVPPAPVYLEVHLMHENHSLLTPLSYKIFDTPRLYGEMVGHMGLLVVHNVGAPFEYSAYDLICPHDYPDRVAIEVIETEKGEALLTAKCPKCHTEYDISMGMGQPIRGKGRYPLLQYPIQNQEYLLIVHN